MNTNILRLATTTGILLALLVVMLGAYTRLTDAGLGCPDWPGCYGHMVLPLNQAALKSAQNDDASLPIEPHKAWTEMVHRYAAGSLALLILFIGLVVLRNRVRGLTLPYQLPCILIFLILFQAALGMWTVTLQLLPIVVTAHLLGGILIFSCLSCFRLQLSTQSSLSIPHWRPWIGIGALIVFYQIALGGWVSSNYAGIACLGFPQCNGQWLPLKQLSQSFNLFSPIGTNYQGGVLDSDMRMTIQTVHRLGALLTALYLMPLLSYSFIKIKNKNWRRLSLLMILLIMTQLTLGVINVVYLLPLWIAVAHNGVAAVLMATLLMLFYLTQGAPKHAH